MPRTPWPRNERQGGSRKRREQDHDHRQDRQRIREGERVGNLRGAVGTWRSTWRRNHRGKPEEPGNRKRHEHERARPAIAAEPDGHGSEHDRNGRANDRETLADAGPGQTADPVSVDDRHARVRKNLGQGVHEEDRQPDAQGSQTGDRPPPCEPERLLHDGTIGLGHRARQRRRGVALVAPTRGPPFEIRKVSPDACPFGRRCPYLAPARTEDDTASMPRLPDLFVRSLALAVLALIVASCTTPGASPPGPTPSAIGGRSIPTGLPSTAPCIHTMVTGEPLSRDIATMATISPFVVVGVFNGTGAAFWSSPGGSPPTTDRASQSLILFTSISITVDGVIRGSSAEANHTATYGGALGCSSVVYDNAVSLVPGTRYLFFGTGPAEDGAGNVTNVFAVFEAWPVSSDDVVRTKLEGDLPLKTVAADIADHPVGPLTYPPISPVPS